MEFIGKVSDSSKIAVFKQLIIARRDSNYHFMPDYALIRTLDNKEPTKILGSLLNANWGGWSPDSNNMLTQNFEHQQGNVEYKLTMSINDAAMKNIYLSVTDQAVFPRKTVIYIATNGYYNNICDGLEQEIHEYDDVLYRESGIGKTWVNVLSHLN